LNQEPKIKPIITMEKYTLRIGGKSCTFIKSPDQIAVRIKPNLPITARAAMHPQLAAEGATRQSNMDGFQVLSVGAGEMEGQLDRLREVPEVSAGTHVYHTSDDGVPFVPTGEIYVKWKPKSSVAERNKLLSDLSLMVQEIRETDTAILCITSASPNPLKVATTLQSSGAVAVAEPDMATPAKLCVFSLPTDPMLASQWHLRNTGDNGGNALGLMPGADARVLDGWELAESVGSASTVVAVIDDGFDLTHPDLSGPGKVVAPWDFTRNNDDPKPDHGGFDQFGNYLGDWHGTACAGVAVGANNGSGIVGAAPACRLMPIRWGSTLSPANVERWFNHALEQGAAVLSCSWGVTAAVYQLPTRTSDAITRCARDGRGGLGVVICFAAGNESSDVNAPDGSSVAGFAIHPDVICVAASTSRDEQAHYSNFGNEIWICAPSNGAGGRGILTADVTGTTQTSRGRVALGYNAGDFAPDFGGTSSATPLVAGICGLLLSLNPNANATEIRQVLRRTARKIGPASGYDDSGHSRIFGYGCVNAAAAVREVLQGTEENLAINPAWGKKGHESTNEKGIAALPDGNLRDFYVMHRDAIVKQAMAADHAKGSDPSEGPRHYLDADRYGAYPFAELPEDYDEAVAKFGATKVRENGLLPWSILNRYRLLVEAFAEGDTDSIVQHSAWLGHYIGDSHVPLHTTENHDGQLTGQKGLHSHFESAVLEFIEPKEIVPPLGSLFSKPIVTLAFEWIRESHLHIPEILQADLDTRRGSQRRRDKAAFAGAVRHIVIERLTKGATRLASAWITAWREAGSPSQPGAAPHAVQVMRTIGTTKPAIKKSSSPRSRRNR